MPVQLSSLNVEIQIGILRFCGFKELTSLEHCCRNFAANHNCEDEFMSITSQAAKLTCRSLGWRRLLLCPEESPDESVNFWQSEVSSGKCTARTLCKRPATAEIANKTRCKRPAMVLPPGVEPNEAPGPGQRWLKVPIKPGKFWFNGVEVEVPRPHTRWPNKWMWLDWKLELFCATTCLSQGSRLLDGSIVPSHSTYICRDGVEFLVRRRMSSKGRPSIQRLSNYRIPAHRATDALRVAIASYNVTLLEAALAARADPNCEMHHESGCTCSALYFVVSQTPAFYSAVAFLLASDADPNRDSKGFPGILEHTIVGSWMSGRPNESPLLQTALTIQALVSHGADVQGSVGQDALAAAVDANNFHAAAALLSAGAIPAPLDICRMGHGFLHNWKLPTSAMGDGMAMKKNEAAMFVFLEKMNRAVRLLRSQTESCSEAEDFEEEESEDDSEAEEEEEGVEGEAAEEVFQDGIGDREKDRELACETSVHADGEHTCRESHNEQISNDIVEQLIHDEPATEISEEEALLVTSEQRNSWTEYRIAIGDLGRRGAPTCTSADAFMEFNTVPSTWHSNSSESGSYPPSLGARSAPMVSALEHCLPLGTFVQTRLRGAVEVTNIQVGDELTSLHSRAIVQATRLFQERERTLVQIQFEGGNVAVTSNHALLVRRPLARNVFQPVVAIDLRIADMLRRWPAGEVRVHTIEVRSASARVVEIELESPFATMFIREFGDFIEAHGALSPRLNENTVKVLTFNRFDNFRETFLQNYELEACRRSLEAAGFSADLSIHGLGPGKMLVPPHLAWPVLLALHTRRQSMISQSACGVGCRNVVVSRETEPTVREIVKGAGPRAIFVVSEEVLTLPQVDSNVELGSAFTCSTNPDANPRMRSRTHRWDSFL